MKKISARMFFTVVWRGVCQVLRWFLGLFGFEREGKFAKCLWGLFATSATVVMVIVAGMFSYVAWDEVSRRWDGWFHNCKDPSCYENLCMGYDIYFHNPEHGKGYIYQVTTGNVLVKDVEWVDTDTEGESLIRFSQNQKYGYFSLKTNNVAIEPRFAKAWEFSDGLARVADDDEHRTVKYIDEAGHVVIDLGVPYNIEGRECRFHDGYCIREGGDGRFGIMDKTGKAVVSVAYDDITYADGCQTWYGQKDGEVFVWDKDLKMVLTLEAETIEINNERIAITMPDRTMRTYDLEGNLLYDNCVYNVRMLEYETDEVCYVHKESDDDGDVYETPDSETKFHPMATARLRAYVAGGGSEGLMTADGRMVTNPIYSDITAIGPDLYLCDVSQGVQVVLNGRGERVMNDE